MAANESGAEALTGPTLISVVDDDEDVRLALEALIDSLGLQPCVFDSAEAFLNSDMPRRSRCVISDIHMAGMSGIDLAVALGKIDEAPPIILISAFTAEDMGDRAIRAGARCFLSKPLDPARLVAELEATLGKQL